MSLNLLEAYAHKIPHSGNLNCRVGGVSPDVIENINKFLNPALQESLRQQEPARSIQAYLFRSSIKPGILGSLIMVILKIDDKMSEIFLGSSRRLDAIKAISTYLISASPNKESHQKSVASEASDKLSKILKEYNEKKLEIYQEYFKKWKISLNFLEKYAHKLPWVGSLNCSELGSSPNVVECIKEATTLPKSNSKLSSLADSIEPYLFRSSIKPGIVGSLIMVILKINETVSEIFLRSSRRLDAIKAIATYMSSKSSNKNTHQKNFESEASDALSKILQEYNKRKFETYQRSFCSKSLKS